MEEDRTEATRRECCTRLENGGRRGDDDDDDDDDDEVVEEEEEEEGVPYVRPAGRQANATQEAFARARSVWPRSRSTTGPSRRRTSAAEVARGRPKRTCAGPPANLFHVPASSGPFTIFGRSLASQTHRPAAPVTRRYSFEPSVMDDARPPPMSNRVQGR
uniref:Uncharacterized protein n=1 Tax=Vespula pensylvanica TaxID=30213 RepID=A0A834PAS7_VESPE|nr:hypothetical protein H0235_002842 [Vespula pensylvanica]